MNLKIPEYNAIVSEQKHGTYTESDLGANPKENHEEIQTTLTDDSIYPNPEYPKQYDIKIFIFDLDDTVWDAYGIFKKYIDELKRTIAVDFKEKCAIGEQIDLSLATLDDLDNDFDIALSDAFRKVFVNPANIWRELLMNLVQKYNLTENDIDRYIEQVWPLYQEVPYVFSEVITTLTDLKKKGVKIYALTHAEEEWTRYKLEKTGLKDYFEEIFYADVNKAKGVDDWKNAIAQIKSRDINLGTNTENIAIVGDNLKGDINPSHEVGIRYKFWINRGEGWGLYREGNVPEGTIRVKSLHLIVEYVKPGNILDGESENIDNIAMRN